MSGPRKLAIGGLTLLAIPTALWIGITISMHYYLWLWGPPPPPLPGGHGQLRGLPTPELAFEGGWQSSLLLGAWLVFWWFLFVRRSGAPWWGNRRALIILAVFVMFTGIATAWSLSQMAVASF